jgi:HK97 gp10 family phage protein
MTTELKNNLPRISSQLERAVAAAVRKAAFKLEAKAKQLAPVDTGHLRNSITTHVEGMSATVSTNVEYAPAQEYGTHRQSGKPFMRPAADSVRASFEAELRKLEGSLK